MNPKRKPIVGGTLLYIALTGILILSALFFAYSIPSFFSILAIKMAILFGFAFMLRRTERASVLHLTLASVILYLLFANAFFFAFGDPLAYLACAGLIAITWIICGLGILAAKWAAAKWPSAKARRTSIGLALTLPLLSLFLYNQTRFIYSGIQAGKTTQPSLKCNASELKSTQVIPTFDIPIVPGTNLIWCAPFQLAWNGMLDLLGEEIHMAKDEPSCISSLNRRSVTREHLDPDTFLAIAGPYTSDLVTQLNRELKQQFGRGTFPNENPPPAGTDNQLAAFGYISANLPFRHAFKRMDQPLIFNETPVEAFGIKDSEPLTHSQEIPSMVGCCKPGRWI